MNENAVLDDVISNMEEGTKTLIICGDIFAKLMQHQRFVMFLTSNYNVEFNKEGNDISVIEIDHNEVASRLMQIMKDYEDTSKTPTH